jgi:hypothetical protein
MARLGNGRDTFRLAIAKIITGNEKVEWNEEMEGNSPNEGKRKGKAATCG